MKHYWYKRIPDHELTPAQRQFAATSKSSATHLCMIRSPSCLQDVLQAMTKQKNTILLWGVKGYMTLADSDFSNNNRCSSLRVGRIEGVRFVLYGPSDQVIAQMASFLWSLPDRAARSDWIVIQYGNRNVFDFSVVTPSQLAALLAKNPGRKTHLHRLTLNAEQASVLASRPHTIDLRLADCDFSAGGDTTFLDVLERRQTCFGNLRLLSDPFASSSLDSLRRLFKQSTLGFLSICPAVLERKDMLLAPYASKVGKLKYCLDETDDMWHRVESITIVPTKCVLKVQCDCSPFPSVFLRATGHLTELGLIYCCVTPSKQELVDLALAVDANQNLKVLEIGYLDRFWIPGWQHLMMILGRHGGLHTLKIKVSMDATKPHYFAKLFHGLRGMLRQNYRIDVLVISPSKQAAKIWRKSLRDTLSFNRFLRGSKSLTKEPEIDRFALLGAALMMHLNHDNRRTAALLADNMDALCVMLQ